ncbi:hypothetical protein KDI_06770 [Dictyobacter arantiisoli]|uniref:Double Cache domain-containing protein n=1 Tax=Dictyobacter arantiisoli TaxID=2014874 RepID=A0A5A5T7W9_9CHLR|nr:hypothetical protein KDI_06770 [Dictyobacter arantiisoli]
MPQFVRQSLLIQLLSVYLLFIIVVLLGGVGVDTVVERQLQNDAQASELALAQDIALDTSQQIHDAESALVALSNLALQSPSSDTTATIFHIFQSIHSDVDHVYWLDPVGNLRGIWPQDNLGVGSEFSPTQIVDLARMATGPVFEVGIAVETTFNAGVIIAEPMRTSDGRLVGIVADSLSLVGLSTPLTKILPDLLI